MQLLARPTNPHCLPASTSKQPRLQKSWFTASVTPRFFVPKGDLQSLRPPPLITACARCIQASRRKSIVLMASGGGPEKPPQQGGLGGAGLAEMFGKLNSAYVLIVAFFLFLLLFRNPYIFAALTIITVLPQNSNVTSLNTLVLNFYESGLFMNFAEAVYCVRLVTWLSISLTLISFALFA